MGRILLIRRLVLKDMRRHPAEVAMFLLAITAASATLALGLALNGATNNLYRQTRAATGGPDVVAMSAQSGKAALTTLAQLEHAPGVVGHSGPYPLVYTMLKAGGSTVRAVVKGADTAPGPIDRPRVTTGGWVRPGGVVVERGFATALGVRVGDRVTVADRSFPVVGIAVTAANMVYPWGEMMGQGGGPDDYSGLVWLTQPNARAVAGPQRPVSYALNLKLADPAATWAFVDSYRTSTIPVNFFTWQFIAVQDAVLLNDTQPVLVIGSWLLGFLAIVGVATLVAGRAAKQTRRAGLLKAVGATPGQIAAVLLAEYLALALLADGLGLIAAWLGAPALANPSAGLLRTATALTGGTVVSVTCLALATAAFTTLGPAVRAARTGTVHALADTARPPQPRPRLTALSARLPTPLLLGLRLTARRPFRAILHAGGIAATVTAITALLTYYAQPQQGYDLGSSILSNLRADQGRHVLLAVTVALVALAAVNIIVITWTTALEARRSLAIARTLGATPGQVTAGLSLAQLLPALPGAITGIPVGIGLYWAFSVGTMAKPSTWCMLAAVLGTLLAVAALTAVPARIAARRPVAPVLSSEAA
jgi:putative ABC transport system permease protein